VGTNQQQQHHQHVQQSLQQKLQISHHKNNGGILNANKCEMKEKQYEGHGMKHLNMQTDKDFMDGNRINMQKEKANDLRNKLTTNNSTQSAPLLDLRHWIRRNLDHHTDGSILGQTGNVPLTALTLIRDIPGT